MAARPVWWRAAIAAILTAGVVGAAVLIRTPAPDVTATGYRGDGAHTGVTSGREVDPLTSIVWRRMGGGEQRRAPRLRGAVAAGEVLVVSTDDGVVALDAGSGRLRWRLPDVVAGPAIDGGRTVAGQRVVLSTGEELLWVSVQDGTIVRRQAIAGGTGRRPALAPVHEGLAIVQAPELTAVDTTTGGLRWLLHSTGERPATGDAGPARAVALAAGVLVLLDDAGTLTGRDVGTGQVQWRAPGKSLAAGPASGVLAVTDDQSGVVSGLGLRTGTVQWEIQDLGAPRPDGLTLAGDRLLALLDGADGSEGMTLAAFEHGEEVARRRLDLPSDRTDLRATPWGFLVVEPRRVALVDHRGVAWSRELRVTTGHPAVAGDLALVPDRDGLTAVALADGATRWRTRLRLPARWHGAGEPAVSGQVAAMTGIRPSAFDAITSRTLWPLTDDRLGAGQVRALPDGFLVLADGVVTRHRRDGSEVWRRSSRDLIGWFDSIVAVVGDVAVLYFMEGMEFNRLISVDLGTGETRGALSTGVAPAPLPGTSSGNAVYLQGWQDAAPVLARLDVTDGGGLVQRWTVGVAASGVVAGPEHIYAVGYASVSALDPASGGLRWSIPLDRPIVDAPALAHGALYLPLTGGELRAVDLRSRRTRWRRVVDGEIATAPSVAGRLLYLGDTTGTLSAVDVRDGRVRSSVGVGAVPAGSPVVVHGSVLLPLRNGGLVAVG